MTIKGRHRTNPACRGVLCACILALAGGARAGVTLDGTVGPAGSLSGPHFAIPAEVGSTRGANLFHSFGRFSLTSSESATFTGPPAIQNIIGRVTGGEASNIDGLVRSSIGGANLYLLNPSGILFGPNARLDVSGSFYASTADYLRLSDGGRFDARNPAASTLTLAPPAAFGFLGGTPAPIGVSGTLSVPSGKSLGLIGGKITVSGPQAALDAPSGRIDLVAVGSGGEVALSPSAPDVSAFAVLGESVIERGARVSTAGDPGGTIYIRSGRLVIESALLDSGTFGATDHPGTGVDIGVRGQFTLGVSADPAAGDSLIDSSSFGPGRAGDIRINAGSFNLAGDPAERGFLPKGLFAEVASRARGPGRGGNIAIDVGELEVGPNASIVTQTLAAGDAGDITIKASSMRVTGTTGHGSFISSSSEGDGNPGDITLSAGEVLLLGGGLGFVGLTLDDGEPLADRSNGALTMNADSLRVLDGAQILTSHGRSDPEGKSEPLPPDLPPGPGGGGREAPREPGAPIVDLPPPPPGSSSSGRGADLVLNVGELEVGRGASISTRSLGSGAAGDITVNANSARIEGLLSSGGGIGGHAGSLNISASDILLQGEGRLTLSAGEPGSGRDSGSLTLTTGRLRVLDGAEIRSSYLGAGSGGNIHVTADAISIAGTNPVGNSAGIFSDVFSLATRSPGENPVEVGNITVTTGDLVMSRDAAIGSIAFVSSEARAGSIQITAQNMELGSGAFLDSRATGPIVALDAISISATRLRLLGGGGGHSNNRPRIGTNASIFVEGASRSGAEVGGIRIDSRDLQILDGARIVVDGLFLAGGAIQIRSDRVLVAGRDAASGQESSIVASSTRTGTRGGNVNLEAGEVMVSDHGRISVESLSPGDAGNLRIAADTILLSGNATLSATATDAGNAGNIEVIARDALHMRNSTITTQATQSEGGNITVAARSMLRLNDSSITASVQGGAGSGGNISIDPQFVVLNHSRIAADAVGGNGGNVSIIAGQFIASADSGVSASSVLGIQGNVVIRAPTQDLSGNLEKLPENALDAAARFKSTCAAIGGRFSSFTVSGPVLAGSGNAWMPSSYSGIGDSGAVARHGADPFVAKATLLPPQGCRL
jgi:filamentous hemagglutinin family protein